MRWWSLLPLLLFQSAWAIDLNISPRYDFIRAKDNFMNRALLQADFTLQMNRLKFFVDGFGEVDRAGVAQKLWRRTEDAAYLQELYLEYAQDSIYFKVGRQANRWSDSWIVPSLDIWTARRYERLFIDPLPFQLSHSSGALFSYVGTSWSADLAAMWEVPQDTYPEPYPETEKIAEEESVNPGLRLKFSWGGLQSTLVAARHLRQSTFGVSANYAFEKFVPKIEVGGTVNEQKNDRLPSRRSAFSTFGCDIFVDQWTFTPQLTGFSNEDLSSQDSSQMVGYLSATYSKGHHEFQWQNFSNKNYTNVFYGASYTYTWRRNWGFTLLAQNYSGENLNYGEIVKEHTGGSLVGVRVQYSFSLAGRK